MHYAIPARGPGRSFLARTPLSPAAQRDIARLQDAPIDYLPGLSSAAKKDRLSRMSYRDFLLQIAQAHPDVIPFYQTRTHGLYGVGIDAVPALDCWGIGLAGFQGLGLEPGPAPRMSRTAAGAATPHREPYRFHFPDGNASIARLLVRTLVPEAVPGHTTEDLVTTRINYAQLDRPGARRRIRLGSLAVRVRQVGGPGSSHEVEVYYARAQRVYAVRGRGCILACWHMVIPSLCPELPATQQEALRYGAKVPLVYTNVALRNWTAFHQLGVRTIAAPGGFHHAVSLHEPISIGTYRYARTPEAPVLLRLVRTPCQPGLPAREQHRHGRRELLTTPFTTFERHLRNELGRMLAPAGFDRRARSSPSPSTGGHTDMPTSTTPCGTPSGHPKNSHACSRASPLGASPSPMQTRRRTPTPMRRSPGLSRGAKLCMARGTSPSVRRQARPKVRRKEA